MIYQIFDGHSPPSFTKHKENWLVTHNILELPASTGNIRPEIPACGRSEDLNAKPPRHLREGLEGLAGEAGKDIGRE